MSRANIDRMCKVFGLESPFNKSAEEIAMNRTARKKSQGRKPSKRKLLCQPEDLFEPMPPLPADAMPATIADMNQVKDGLDMLVTMVQHLVDQSARPLARAATGQTERVVEVVHIGEQLYREIKARLEKDFPALKKQRSKKR
jgi:hypothetical protein